MDIICFVVFGVIVLTILSWVLKFIFFPITEVLERIAVALEAIAENTSSEEEEKRGEEN